MNNYLQTRLYDINFNLYESITLSLQKRNRTNILGIETDNDKILQWRAGKAFEGFKNFTVLLQNPRDLLLFSFCLTQNMRGVSSIKFGVQK